MLAPSIGSRQRTSAIDEDPYRPPLPAGIDLSPGHSYWGLYKVCVSDEGAVTAVTTTKEPEPPIVDADWVATIRKWQYRPYNINYRPVPFCTISRIQASGEGVTEGGLAR